MRKKTLIIAACLFCMILDLGNCSKPWAQGRNSNSPNNSADASTGVPDEQYHPVSINIWGVDEKGTKVEARVETREGPPKEGAHVGGPSRLIIKNLATSETIFQEFSGDTPKSAYVRVLNDEVGEALLVTWAGGSADRLEIVEVNTHGARVILKESYRIDAAFIDLSGVGKADLFITTANSGTGPFHTTRYVWKDGRYQPMGKTLYKELARAINARFGIPSVSRRGQPR